MILQTIKDHHETVHKTNKLSMLPEWKNRKSNQQYYLHFKREKGSVPLRPGEKIRKFESHCSLFGLYVFFNVLTLT